MIVRLFTLLGVLGWIGLSLGCADQPRVMVITSTMVGLEAKPPMGDAQPIPSISLAYKRAEMVLVPVCPVTEYGGSKDPKKRDGVGEIKTPATGEVTPQPAAGRLQTEEAPNQPCTPKASKDADAYAVVGSFQMAHNWFGPLIIRQFIATGMAARHLVTTPTVHVIEEVKNPGRHPFTKGLTVKQAIDLAGGRTDQASPDTAYILRHTKDHQEKLEGKSETLLLPDDILNIVKAQWFHISGEVKTPGHYLHEKGMTIEKALSAAGGLIDKEKQGKINATQIEKADPTSKMRELGTNAPVLPDDIIVVEPQTQTVGQVKKQEPASQVSEQGKSVESAPKDKNATVGKATEEAGKGSEGK